MLSINLTVICLCTDVCEHAFCVLSQRLIHVPGGQFLAIFVLCFIYGRFIHTQAHWEGGQPGRRTGAHKPNEKNKCE